MGTGGGSGQTGQGARWELTDQAGDALAVDDGGHEGDDDSCGREAHLCGGGLSPDEQRVEERRC